MSSRGQEHATELRLDYKELVAGQLVIVIQGVPSTNPASLTDDAGGLRIASAIVKEAGGNGSPSSPLIREAEAINEATAYAPAFFTRLLLAAWRGREALALELIAATIEEATFEDVRTATAITEYAKAVLYNGLGRYEQAVVPAQRACAQEDLGLSCWAQFELVEAGARGDACAIATDSLRRLETRARAAGTDWELGVWARSAALLTDGDAAEDLYREAIERFNRARIAAYLPRAQLAYGEWLRRENRRLDAREQLRAAYETFTGIAADAFAERTRRELSATGATARKRTDDSRDILTPQEAQIAALAREGFSNPEIATQLFISSRTVQYHLRKVFRKLGITSRNQLGRLPASSLSST